MGLSYSSRSQNRLWWQHGLFWLGFALLTARAISTAPGTPLEPSGILLRLIVLGTAAAIAVYFNLEVLIPRLLARGRPWIYGAALAGLILVTGAGLAVIYHEILDVGRNEEVAPGTVEWSDGLADRLPGTGAEARDSELILPSFLRLFSIFSLFTAVWVGASSVVHLAKSTLRARSLGKQKLQAELTALKAQLNPHFLFNSLNNIYSLTLDKSDLAPDYVLKLSDLMRYILRSNREADVLLREELDFVQSYFDLEKIRTENRVKLTLSIEGNTDNVRIAPLLLLPFVENAFKHGLSLRWEGAFVSFVVHVIEQTIDVTVLNSKDSLGEAQPDQSATARMSVGLENVRRRLALLYPNRHRLLLHDLGSQFEVKLRLER